MEHPAQRLAALLSVLATPALAETEPFGCELNPTGSLTVLAGDARLGEVLLLGVDNPLGTQNPGSVSALMLSLTPPFAHPCGLPLAGYGMAGGDGGLLVDVFGPAPVIVLPGGIWTGAGAPSPVALSVPASPEFAGVGLWAQGLLFGPAPSGGPQVGLTDGLRMVLERGCEPAAPCVDVTSVNRTARAFAYGFDYEYDNGAEVVTERGDHVTHWTGIADLDLEDWYGVPVANTDATHTAALTGRRITGSFDTRAEAFGNLYHADGAGTAELDVAFDVPALVRYTGSANGVVSYGYNEVTTTLSGPAGSVFHVGGQLGESHAGQRTGWLQPGAHTLHARAEAMAFGGDPEVQTAVLDFAVTFHPAADFDLDGDVDPDDQLAFEAALGTGPLDADVDGDGDEDLDDRAAFDAAYLAAS